MKDFENFEFVAQVEPKTDPKGKPLPGSVVNWKSMRPAGGADEKAFKDKGAATEKGEGEDLEDIPF